MLGKITNIRKEAEGTYSIYFKTKNKLSYYPGQYYYFTLPKLKYDDSKGATRDFTLSTSPTKKDMRFTTRIRETSGYKKTLIELKNGDEIEINGPNGTFIVDEHEKGPHVFVAGGIGITPIISFLEYKLDKGLPYEAYLFYSNSKYTQEAFKTELDKILKQDSNFHFIETYTELTPKGWKGLTSRLSGKIIKKAIPKNIFDNATFWVSGPPVMVKAIEDDLENTGVNPDHIRSDKFTGY